MRLERTGRRAAGVGDQDVDAAKPRECFRGNRVGPFLRRYVGDDGVNVGVAAGADLRARARERIAVTRADDDARAFAGKLLGDRSPKAAARRSDERDAAAQSEVHARRYRRR